MPTEYNPNGSGEELSRQGTGEDPIARQGTAENPERSAQDSSRLRISANGHGLFAGIPGESNVNQTPGVQHESLGGPPVR